MKPCKSNHYAYNSNLRQLANNLRHRMTKAKACLWKYALKHKQMKGYQFRRQRPVLNYIADFMCMDLMLFIEVDGITHLLAETIERDAITQKFLEKAGFAVIRFDDDEVLKDVENVIFEIEGFISGLENNIVSNSLRNPLPPPAPASGGNAS